jgi:hypothetical protein
MTVSSSSLVLPHPVTGIPSSVSTGRYLRQETSWPPLEESEEGNVVGAVKHWVEASPPRQNHRPQASGSEDSRLLCSEDKSPKPACLNPHADWLDLGDLCRGGS